MSRNRKDIQDARKKLLDGISVPKQKKFSPDEFQLEAIESVLNDVDTLVVAPTGTGKTFIAVEGIKKALEAGKRAIYTTPLKALSNTKFVEFKNLFEPKYSVGLLTGDRKIEPDADVVVATTEIYRNDLFNYGESYSLVVLDELHYVADPHRGPVWEESIILSPPSTTLLMLSASISNSDEIADWISDVRGKEVKIVTETERRVPLRYAFLHPSLGIIPLSSTKGSLSHEVALFYKGGSEKSQGKSRKKNYSRGSRSSSKKPAPSKKPASSKKPSNSKKPSKGKK